MKYMDTQAIVSVRKVMMLVQPLAKYEKLVKEINDALEDGWELAELEVVAEEGNVCAQLVKINMRRYE